MKGILFLPALFAVMFLSSCTPQAVKNISNSSFKKRSGIGSSDAESQHPSDASVQKYPANHSGLRYCRQIRGNWCYAAASKSIIRYFLDSSHVEQIDIVRAENPGSCTLNSPMCDDDCDVDGIPLFCLATIGLNCSFTNKDTSEWHWEEIQSEIGGHDTIPGRPFIFEWHYALCNTNHVLIAAGCGTTPHSRRCIYVYDPWDENLDYSICNILRSDDVVKRNISWTSEDYYRGGTERGYTLEGNYVNISVAGVSRE